VCDGYKGMLHQPDLGKECNLLEGINATRKLHLRVLEETGLTTADELLYPDVFTFLEDIVSYVAVGARSVENQLYRMVSSGLEVPVGMKNPTSGDISVMINAIHFAQAHNELIYKDWEVKTTGNEYAHAVLRGAVDNNGKNIPNYKRNNIIAVIKKYEQANMKNSAIIVDVSHSNSNKNYKNQFKIAKDVLNSRKQNEKINKFVKGIMIESYLVQGNQNPYDKNRVFGKSVTDECIGWEETEELLNYIHAGV
jgi:3-deoxy-7-phosphoheptulonate synthase